MQKPYFPGTASAARGAGVLLRVQIRAGTARECGAGWAGLGWAEPYAWAGGVVVGADAAEAFAVAGVCSAGLPSGTRGAGCSADALRTAVAYFSRRWNTRFTICVSAALAVTSRAPQPQTCQGHRALGGEARADEPGWSERARTKRC